jgi:hypothetical protein
VLRLLASILDPFEGKTYWPVKGYSWIGKTLVLEVKGQDDEQNKTKREFLAEWVEAVNAHGGFGIWACDVSRHAKDVGGILHRHNYA